MEFYEVRRPVWDSSVDSVSVGFYKKRANADKEIDEQKENFPDNNCYVLHHTFDDDE